MANKVLSVFPKHLFFSRDPQREKLKENKASIGVFSDIHANLAAFQVVLFFLIAQNVDLLISLGDIVDCGPFPNECCDLLRKSKAAAISGNHEKKVENLFDLESAEKWDKVVSPSASQANYEYVYNLDRVSVWTHHQLTQENRIFLSTLPESRIYPGLDFEIHHTYPPNRFISCANEAANLFSFMQTRVSFIGHSHQLGYWLLKDGTVSGEPFYEGSKLDLQGYEKIIINTGAVGWPSIRTGHFDPRATCVIFHPPNTVEFYRLEYDVKSVLEKMMELNFPTAYISQWDIKHA